MLLPKIKKENKNSLIVEVERCVWAIETRYKVKSGRIHAYNFGKRFWLLFGGEWRLVMKKSSGLRGVNPGLDKQKQKDIRHKITSTRKGQSSRLDFAIPARRPLN